MGRKLGPNPLAKAESLKSFMHEVKSLCSR